MFSKFVLNHFLNSIIYTGTTRRLYAVVRSVLRVIVLLLLRELRDSTSREYRSDEFRNKLLTRSQDDRNLLVGILRYYRTVDSDK
jgi:hypothetical protein